MLLVTSNQANCILLRGLLQLECRKEYCLDKPEEPAGQTSGAAADEEGESPANADRSSAPITLYKHLSLSSLPAFVKLCC